MGNAAAVAALPDRIDATTARALIGNEKNYKHMLARAPWVVSRWRSGRTISGNEALEIWERETLQGGARASLDMLRARPEVVEENDAAALNLSLEIELSVARAELRTLRPLRREAQELPILRGKLRKMTESTERYRQTAIRLERALREEKIENARLRRMLSTKDAPAVEEKQSRGNEASTHSQAVDDEESLSRKSLSHSADDKQSESNETSSQSPAADDIESAVDEEKSHSESSSHSDRSSEEKDDDLLTETERNVAKLLITYEDKGGDLADAFRRWDSSRDGSLSSSEIFHGLVDLGHGFEALELDDVKSLLKRFDKTGDGHFSLLEFESFVLTCKDYLKRK